VRQAHPVPGATEQPLVYAARAEVVWWCAEVIEAGTSIVQKRGGRRGRHGANESVSPQTGNVVPVVRPRELSRWWG